MDSVITKFEQKYRKPKIGEIRSGDTVRVHQTIREAGKSRTQVFEGTVIRSRKQKDLMASIAVRRIASGVGVEKSFLLHSPNIIKVEVVKRSKVRRNYLSYMRERTGKGTRLSEQEFDQSTAGVAEVEQPKEEKQDEEAKAEKTTEKSQESKNDAKATSKADKKSEEEPKTDDKKETKEDKSAEKKAKAEAFRKEQEDKAKK